MIQPTPTFIEEFRLFKLESMLKDLQKLTPEELSRIRREIDYILSKKEKPGDAYGK
jgi:hypothetical protein